MTLIECPVGLFKFRDILCLKTEYFCDGRVEAYVVSSGERFWGCPGLTVDEFNNLVVTPLKLRWGCVLVTNIDAMAKG